MPSVRFARPGKPCARCRGSGIEPETPPVGGDEPVDDDDLQRQTRGGVHLAIRAVPRGWLLELEVPATGKRERVRFHNRSDAIFWFRAIRGPEDVPVLMSAAALATRGAR